MSDTHAHLIDRLSSELTPVRRYAPAWARAIAWSAAIVVLAGIVVAYLGLERAQQRLPPASQLMWSLTWPLLTAFTAAWAAFETSIPGSDRRWAWLPAPFLSLWVAASGVECLLHALAPATRAPQDPPPMECLAFIVIFSLPLCGLLFAMLRRTLPLAPTVTAALAGLAAAAGAAALLALCHPVRIAILDLSVHAGAVLLIVAATRVVGSPLLALRLV